jgi:hypothetical protein
MKAAIDLRSLALGVILGAGVMFSIAASPKTSDKRFWDYKTVAGSVFSGEQNLLENGINSAVAGGWEFVTASHLDQHYGFAVMRREKQ